MNVADQSILNVREVGDIGIAGKQAGGTGVDISDIVGEEEIPGEMQQAEMTPVAGVKFLAMKQEVGGGGSGIGFRAEISNVGDTLFFVYDKVLND